MYTIGWNDAVTEVSAFKTINWWWMEHSFLLVLIIASSLSSPFWPFTKISFQVCAMFSTDPYGQGRSTLCYPWLCFFRALSGQSKSAHTSYVRPLLTLLYVLYSVQLSHLKKIMLVVIIIIVRVIIALTSSHFHRWFRSLERMVLGLGYNRICLYGRNISMTVS